LLAAGRDVADASVVMLAHLAVDAGYRAAPAAEVVQLTTRALDGGVLLDVVGPGSATFMGLVHALRTIGDADLSRTMIEAGEHVVRERGLRSAGFFIDRAWAIWHLDFGSVATAAALARTGLERARETGFGVTVGLLGCATAETLVEEDKVGAAAAVPELDAAAGSDSAAAPFACAARGLVRWLRGDAEGAEADYRRAVELLDARDLASPMLTGARLRLAGLLVARGREDEARELVAAELARAQRIAAPLPLAVVLRTQAQLVPADEAADVLQEAVRLLEATPSRRRLGWTLHDLGALLRRTGHRRDAREPLRRALELGTRTEAGRLARHAREELAAAGSRPRSPLATGVEGLTPSERRVADLAADGFTNREIAERLWVTVKTVEVHLGHAYAKLGIRSRGELPSALGVAA
jgi:DNA-binding CsgD family transcriptional regulator